MSKLYLGYAGEFRVMSELLLRGYNPAKLYNGADLILDDGRKIEVKCCHFTNFTKPLVPGAKRVYNFNFYIKDFDFAIVWCFDDNDFYIIPVSEIYGNSISIPDKLFDKYKEAWDILKLK